MKADFADGGRLFTPPQPDRSLPNHHLSPEEVGIAEPAAVQSSAYLLSLKMSFGFSVSDILALSQLATRVYQGWETACGDYAYITDDLAAFDMLTSRVKNEAQNPTSVFLNIPDDFRAWKKLSNGCRSVLIELERILSKYAGLDTGRRRTFERIEFSCRNLDALRQQLVMKTTNLAAYLSII